MGRICFAVRLLPGAEEIFDSEQQSAMPKLAPELRASGLANVTAFRRGTDVWFFAETDRNLTSGERSESATVFARYWRECCSDLVAGILEPDHGLLFYDEVFHAAGRNRIGSFERGILSLVIRPNLYREYDARHAEPWPDLMQAIDEAGYRNYTGFRRGVHVLYYGEFFPDRDTVLSRIGATEVNARWDEVFASIISIKADPNGGPIWGDEIVHLE